RSGPDQPRVAHLAYVLDSGRGTWVSADAAPHPWAAARVPTMPASWEGPMPYGSRPARTGPAPAVKAPAPELTILDERREGDLLVLRLRARSLRGAYQIGLHTDADVRGGTIEAPGLPPVPLPRHGRYTGAWPYELQFFAPPASGVEIELRVGGTARPRLAVTDLTLGLDGIPGHLPRPKDVDLAPFDGGLPTDSVTVVGTPAGGAYDARPGAGHTISR
ncbi:MAG: hypothetical protein HOV96_26650, partial [Nonomuraea sp.]|nr:hypothetical protein [Nonomuraea sp.]